MTSNVGNHFASVLWKLLTSRYVLPLQDEEDEDDDEGQEDGPDISSPNDVEDCHIIPTKSCAELPLVTLPMARSAADAYLGSSRGLLK